MSCKEFPQGITVTELKKLIADWEETDDTGNPLEVWVGTGAGVCRPIVRATNFGAVCASQTRPRAHLLLESDAAVL